MNRLRAAFRELGFVSLALITLSSILVILAAPAIVLIRSPSSPELRQALADHAKTTAELRAASAKLRANCHGPSWQRMPYRRDT